MSHGCALYEGWVRHRRIAPHPHAFRYPIYMSCLDLDTVEDSNAMAAMDTASRRWLNRYRRDDHFGNPEVSLSSAVRELVFDRRGFHAAGPISLVAHLRCFGYVMNPVSFYYCWSATGQSLDAVVAEVNNTPWGETHCYVLDMREAAPSRRHQFSKLFHVSPFMAMDQQYRWLFTVPGERLVVQMENLQESALQFDATLVMQRVEPTTKSLRRIRWRYPLMTYGVIASIYLQALRLWIKRTPVHTHPGKCPVHTPIPVEENKSESANSR